MPALTGVYQPPGDKSISHRVFILAALAGKRCVIHNPLVCQDTQATLHCLEQLGSDWQQEKNSIAMVPGKRPEAVAHLHAANSGTTARLLLGVLVRRRFASILDGDESLRNRPMERVVTPLRAMGGRIRYLQKPGRLPLHVLPAQRLRGGRFFVNLPSAQVKSALLLAGLGCEAPLHLYHPYCSRDHTERLFAHLGLPMERHKAHIQLRPGADVPAFSYTVAGDFSSAFFFLTAALLVPGSRLRILSVGVNPTRIGALKVLQRMGARLTVRPGGEHAGEPTGDIQVSPMPLRGTTVHQVEVPALIDELPALCLCMARATSPSVIHGVGELRHKESDRLAGICTLLADLARFTIQGDSLYIHPGRRTSSPIPDAGNFSRDHRLAMLLAIKELLLRGNPGRRFTAVAVSYPDFYKDLERLIG